MCLFNWLIICHSEVRVIDWQVIRSKVLSCRNKLSLSSSIICVDSHVDESQRSSVLFHDVSTAGGGKAALIHFLSPFWGSNWKILGGLACLFWWNWCVRVCVLLCVTQWRQFPGQSEHVQTCVNMVLCREAWNPSWVGTPVSSTS